MAAGATAAGVVVATDQGSSGHPEPDLPEVALGAQPAGLPARQHAWEAVLARDAFGNAVSPKFDRLLLFDVRGTPTTRHARILEAALRTLERTYRWGPEGLLFTVGWGPGYFRTALALRDAPIPEAKALSDFETPQIDDYDLCLHIACDDEQRLRDVEASLLHGTPLPGNGSGVIQVSDALIWKETRTGFAGAGLPAARQHVGGIPAGDPVPKTSPLYMGFKSALKKNQASEDAVTIVHGPFAQGTTMAVSYMRLSLQSWYGNLSQEQRIERMYSPQTTERDVAAFTTDAESNPDQIDQAITEYGVVGHSQTQATIRRNGSPLILRRDFDTDDGGQAGLHFVSLQRTIDDFVTTRTAMNASGAAQQNPSITATDNNGINAFIFVLKRANYILPARADRSFPLLPGRLAER